MYTFVHVLCLCDLLLIGLWQRFYDDLSWMLHLQLPDCLLRRLPGHLLCNAGRFQTLLLQPVQQGRNYAFKHKQNKDKNKSKLLLSHKCCKFYTVTPYDRSWVAEISHSGPKREQLLTSPPYELKPPLQPPSWWCPSVESIDPFGSLHLLSATNHRERSHFPSHGNKTLFGAILVPFQLS